MAMPDAPSVLKKESPQGAKKKKYCRQTQKAV
jgi:hypothetical protein